MLACLQIFMASSTFGGNLALHKPCILCSYPSIGPRSGCSESDWSSSTSCRTRYSYVKEDNQQMGRGCEPVYDSGDDIEDKELLMSPRLLTDSP